jgi:F5/8 type C domain
MLSNEHQKLTAVRKRPLAELMARNRVPEAQSPVELELAAGATIYYSSENPEHPIEHLVDGNSGRGGSRWVAAKSDTTEQIVFEFAEPVDISRIEFEVEELRVERTQEVTAGYSVDGGQTYRVSFVQEYTFSPSGSTYQRESLAVQFRGVTHLRLTVVPNKGGSGAASLTSLRLYA